MRWIPFLFLLGCPVEPKDVQDTNQGKGGPSPQNQMQGGKPGGNGQGQGMGQGKPPGQPPTGEGQPPTGEDGDTIPLPPVDGGENPAGEQEGVQNNGENAGNPEGVVQNGAGEGNAGQANPPSEQNEENVNGNATPNFANEGQVGTPPEAPLSGDILPMYQNLPQFSDLIKGDSITISLNVSGATSFDFEFVVKREGDGRIYPKVLHKESGAVSPVTINAPISVDEPVWLVITADKTGDGPTPDDLVGGSIEALSIDGSDLSLEYTLSEDSDFLKNLPWFSQASDGPGLQDGM